MIRQFNFRFDVVQPSIRCLQLSNQRLWNRQHNACIIVDSTLVRPLNQHLHDRRFDDYSTVELTLAQPSIVPLHNCRFNCRFDARFQNLMYMPFRTWIHFIFRYFTSYLDALYYRDKFQKLKNYWWRISYLKDTHMEKAP